MQIKTPVKYQYIGMAPEPTKQKISIGKDVGRLEVLCNAGEKVKWFSCHKNSMAVPQKIKHRFAI
jgi:hypothetical protein